MPISEAIFGILVTFPILQGSKFSSANYHPYPYCPLINTPYIYIWVRGDNQRTSKNLFLDPKLAVESIGEVPRVPRAHLKVEFAQTIVRFAPPLYV